MVSRFFSLFSFCVLGVIVIFVSLDLIENVDRFIDMQVPWHLVAVYYLFYMPYIIALTLPMASMLATSILIGGMAKANEITATKALGFSYYQVMTVLLFLGLGASALSFGIVEGVVAPATRKRIEMEREYLKKHQDRDRTRYQDLQIQEPPNQLITIDEFNIKTDHATQVRIETYDDYKLVSRIDSPNMIYKNGEWIITSGYQRTFSGLEETATAITDTVRFHFRFTPKELVKVKISPEEMSIFELYRFAMRIRESGGEIYKWMTDLHLRISFPLSNLFIIFLCVPIVYNRRQKSMAVGVGISLLICFIYFGLVKIGETLGDKRELTPFIGAWMGNGLAFITGLFYLFRIRK